MLLLLLHPLCSVPSVRRPSATLQTFGYECCNVLDGPPVPLPPSPPWLGRPSLLPLPRRHTTLAPRRLSHLSLPFSPPLIGLSAAHLRTYNALLYLAFPSPNTLLHFPPEILPSLSRPLPYSSFPFPILSNFPRCRSLPPSTSNQPETRKR